MELTELDDFRLYEYFFGQISYEKRGKELEENISHQYVSLKGYIRESTEMCAVRIQIIVLFYRLFQLYKFGRSMCRSLGTRTNKNNVE